MISTRAHLEAQGFVGFVSIGDLKSGGYSLIPKLMGVYAVVRASTTAPVFRRASIGGHSKGKNPTLDVASLKKHWVDGVDVVYIGKAGGFTSSATLAGRLRQYIEFGKGKPIGHWGGRLIWQLEDCDDLLVAWKPLCDVEPRMVEQKMIADFVTLHGRMPFANLAS